MKIMPLTHTTVRALLVSLMLLTGALPSTAQNPDRSRPPELLPPPSLRLPPIQRFHLSNGVSVMLLEKHEVPLVQIALLVRAGSVNDPAGKEGLAAMTAQMMTEGAGARDALALADAIDFLGADINASAGLHRMDVSMFAPLSKLDSALALMADVALHPALPPPAATQPAAQPAQATPAADGSRVRGAARGAAAGAIIGEVADDDAGKGAAIGATAGVVAGGRQSRKNQQQAAQQATQQQQQAAQQTQAANQQQLDLFKKGFAACLEPKGYTVK